VALSASWQRASQGGLVARLKTSRAVKAGGHRQELHEKIRLYSITAAAQVKQFGKPNDLIARLRADLSFAKVDFEKVLNPKNYVGRAPQQVDEFLRSVVVPIQKRYRNELIRKVDLHV
jgi:adenylosuccinate lyase